MPSDPSDEERRLLDRSPIGIFRSTRDGRLIYANPALAQLLGYTVAELMTKNVMSDIYVDGALRMRLVDQLRRDGHLDGPIVDWRKADGSIAHIKVFGHVNTGRSEAADGVTFEGHVVDITEQTAQRAQLATTVATLDLVVGQLPALYWVCDRELRITYAGGGTEEVLGYPQTTFRGHTIGEVHAFEPGSTEPVSMHARALAGETVSYSTDYRGKHLVVTVAPHRQGGTIAGVIGTCIDVTAYHRLERRMVDAQRAESLGVLAGGLAHDFNNLLVAILGNVDLGLREIPPHAPGRRAVENIRQAGLRAAELTDQLLAYAGRGGVAVTRVPPAPLVDELLRIVGPTLPANVAVRVDVPADLAIRGDATQVRQVLLNLIANARDALAERGGTIDVTASSIRTDGVPERDEVVTPAAGSYVLIEVVDDGPGMPRDTRRRVFEPFFTTKPTGHGLGLAAVLGIVRTHGGGLRLSSAPGAGARFGVLWPATHTPVVQAAVVETPGRTVLVIDDEDLVRDVIARMVEDLGYTAVTASCGADGLALVAANAPDAVLVDLTMPNMSGAEVVATLRASHPGLPVVLCTGFDRERRGPIEADAYLGKPFRLTALEETLGKIFAGR
ncbi:MAG TPA: ATP-binding protein [Kofleriaceae bacterium]